MNLNISKNSWHYRLISMYGFDEKEVVLSDDDEYIYVSRLTNSCKYTRALAISCGLTFAFLLAVIGTIASAADFAMWVLVSIMSGVRFPVSELGGFGQVLMMLVSVFSFAALILFVNYRVRASIEKRRIRKLKQEPAEPSAFDELVKSFKDKVCKKITIVE